jgi:pyridoxamine 5'-phosphate oxidase
VSPLELLANDRRAAQQARDPWANLCVLATVDANGFPQARVLVLRDVEDRLGLFVNSTSPKCAELARTPRVAVLTYLASRSTQYRLGANVSPIDSAMVRSNWQLRPAIPKTMDWLYTTRIAQGGVVASRDALVALQAAIAVEIGAEPVAPETAVGFYLDIDLVERLELANDRVHDRRRYTKTIDGWREEVLVP